MANEWYCHVDGQDYGPMTALELRELVAESRLHPDDWVRKEDSPDWVPAKKVRGLFEGTAGTRLSTSSGAIDPVPLAEPATGATREPTRSTKTTSQARMLPVTEVRDCISREEKKARLGFYLLNGIVYLFLTILVVSTFGVMLIFYAVGWVINQLLAEYHVRKLMAYGTAAGPDQFPEISSSLSAICDHFGVREQPRVIILNNPMINAFAVRFAQKKVIVLLSEILEGVLDKPEQLRFILGHEMGHMMLDHSWRGRMAVLKPARFSAGRELTCDNVGTVAAGQAESAKEALKRLGVGNKLFHRLDESYLSAEAKYIFSGITGWLLKSYLTYPPLGRRIENVGAFFRSKSKAE
jgi:Zn-dependent protease with chaperone function